MVSNNLLPIELFNAVLKSTSSCCSSVISKIYLFSLTTHYLALGLIFDTECTLNSSYGNWHFPFYISLLIPASNHCRPADACLKKLVSLCFINVGLSVLIRITSNFYSGNSFLEFCEKISVWRLPKFNWFKSGSHVTIHFVKWVNAQLINDVHFGTKFFSSFSSWWLF